MLNPPSWLSSGEGLLLARLMCIPIIRVINIITIITDHSRVPIIRDNFHLTDTGSCVALHRPGNVMTSELSVGNCDHQASLWPGNVTLWHHHDNSPPCKQCRDSDETNYTFRVSDSDFLSAVILQSHLPPVSHELTMNDHSRLRGNIYQICCDKWHWDWSQPLHKALVLTW